MTFNHGVEGSSPSALTNEINYLIRSPVSSKIPRVCTVSANALRRAWRLHWRDVGRALLIILCAAAIVALLVSAPPPPKCIEIGSMPIGGDCRR